MRVTYDRSVDAAYIYLVDKMGFGQVKKEYHCDIKKVGGIINLNFDLEGRLIGIEILGASHRLLQELLDKAEIIG